MSDIPSVEEALARWKESLVTNIPIGSLHSRNPVAYKWKALFRTFMLRETVFWRLQDLLAQSYVLHQKGHALGARILLRSGVESVAILINLNQSISSVLAGTLNFHLFCSRTTKLVLGSRNGQTSHEAINIITVLQHCNKKYPKFESLYGNLSESAHPNFEGLQTGYSKIDHDEDEVNFSNRWFDMYSETHVDLINLCITIFDEEYNEVWPELMDKLEKWVEAHDAELEASKN